MKILALSKNQDPIEIEAVARVEKPYRQVSTRVEQTNILLSDSAVIRAIPRLEIATDDIEGGHACRVHRLSGETLFYLESR
jgi:Fe-S cluster assembly scaffold protein SufB